MISQQDVNGAIEKELRSKTFKFDGSSDWYKAAAKGLKLRSLIALGLFANEFIEIYELITKKKPLNYFQFSIVSNAFESCSCHELEYEMNEFIGLMKEAQIHTTSWNDQVNKIKSKVMEEIIKKTPLNDLPPTGVVRTLKN